MQDYKPNSHRFREEKKKNPEEKKVEKVVKGGVKRKKKNEIHKFADVFISEDISSVKSYIFLDVLVPAVKKAILDIVTNGADMLLYGGNSKGRKSSNASFVSYRNYSDRDRRTVNDSRASGYSCDDLIFDSRGEAEEVLTRMDELLDSYGLATVADLYDLVGVTGNYTDCKYGWTSLRYAEVVRVRDGWKIKLPKALPID